MPQIVKHVEKLHGHFLSKVPISQENRGLVKTCGKSPMGNKPGKTFLVLVLDLFQNQVQTCYKKNTYFSRPDFYNTTSNTMYQRKLLIT